MDMLILITNHNDERISSLLFLCFKLNRFQMRSYIPYSALEPLRKCVRDQSISRWEKQVAKNERYG